jgi:predicted acyltransferase
MGVLNRIALAYGVASFIVLRLSFSKVKIATAVVLLAYWAVLVLFGGDDPFSLESNFVGKFDAFVLGENHLRKFRGATFDQTGLLSTFPSIGNVLLGYIAGSLIDMKENKLYAVKRLMIYGIIGVIVGRIWDVVFPINKPLWTSSFVLVTAGWANLVLGLIYYLTDMRGIRFGSIFSKVGANAITVYFLSSFIAKLFYLIRVNEDHGVHSWLFDTLYVHDGIPLEFSSLLYGLSVTGFYMLLGWWMYRKGIFIKV